MQIRLERAADITAVHALNRAAFETSTEADLVDVLRQRAKPIISLVADDAGSIVGHILFSPVTLSGHGGLKIMGLAPMAVLPAQQRRGIGSAFVRAGLESCKQLGRGAIVVLGHPEYYPRFGFVPASRFGIGCEYEVPTRFSWRSSSSPASCAANRAPSATTLHSRTCDATGFGSDVARAHSGTLLRGTSAWKNPRMILGGIESGRMRITVRPLRADEGRIYLEIVNSAIRGLAVNHYPPDAIEGWVVPVTNESVRDLMLNADHEIRLIAEMEEHQLASEP